MNLKFASFLSVIGHPLLTVSLFAIIALFTYEEFHRVLLHSIFIVGGIFLPLALKIYLSSKIGTYTNFGVSNKTQRHIDVLSYNSYLAFIGY